MVMERHTAVGGRRLFCREWGPPDAHPLLLVHGYPGHTHVWDRFAEAMSATHRLIAVDLSGLGQSDWADDYSFAGWVDDLRHVASELALPPFTMVGHSLGSTISLSFAAAHPALVRQVVAIDGFPLGAWEPTTPNAGALPARFSDIGDYLAFRGQSQSGRPVQERYEGQCRWKPRMAT